MMKKCGIGITILGSLALCRCLINGSNPVVPLFWIIIGIYLICYGRKDKDKDKNTDTDKDIDKGLDRNTHNANEINITSSINIMQQTIKEPVESAKVSSQNQITEQQTKILYNNGSVWGFLIFLLTFFVFGAAIYCFVHPSDSKAEHLLFPYLITSIFYLITGFHMAHIIAKIPQKREYIFIHPWLRNSVLNLNLNPKIVRLTVVFTILMAIFFIVSAISNTSMLSDIRPDSYTYEDYLSSTLFDYSAIIGVPFIVWTLIIIATKVVRWVQNG